MQDRIVSLIVTIVGLLVTFTVIDSTVAQAVVGAASVLVPAIFQIITAINGHAAAVVRAAEISRPQPVHVSMPTPKLGTVRESAK